MNVVTPTMPRVATDVGSASAASAISDALLCAALEADVIARVGSASTGLVVDLGDLVAVADGFRDTDTAARVGAARDALESLRKGVAALVVRVAGPAIADALAAASVRPTATERRLAVDGRTFKTRRGALWVRAWALLHPGAAAAETLYDALERHADTTLSPTSVYEAAAAALSGDKISGHVACMRTWFAELEVSADAAPCPGDAACHIR